MSSPRVNCTQLFNKEVVINRIICILCEISKRYKAHYYQQYMATCVQKSFFLGKLPAYHYVLERQQKMNEKLF